jgi:hypothetical protein
MSELKEKSSFVNVYEPYVIKTRKNDLNTIIEKNIKKQEKKKQERHKSPDYVIEPDYLGDMLEIDRPLTTNQFFNRKAPNFGLY